MLRNEGAVDDHWRGDELRGGVASRVVAASEGSDLPESIRTGVAHLRGAGTTLVLIPVANVLPPDGPLAVADCVIGQVDETLRSVIETVANGRPVATSAVLR